MALLQKLKEMLGIGGTTERTRHQETAVTVEHEPEDLESESDASGAVDTIPDEPEESVAAAAEETAEATAEGESVEEISGIGPAYAERLEEIGITTVQELAAADAASIAEQTNIGEGRANTWIERANDG